MENYIASLDKILSHIKEPTLTDSEIETIRPKDPDSLQEKYDTLGVILQNRGGVGNSLEKLRADASIFNIVIDEPAREWSNLLIGLRV
jgi:hypothetical protein